MDDRVHVSLDDTKGCFKYLAAHPDTESIFDTRVLGFLKELHDEYGTGFTLLCIYKSGDFTLDQVSDRYQKEFLENRDWLHFGFHAYEENRDYSRAGAEQIQEEYQITMKHLKRITGADSFSKIIRLHRFAGNLEVCRALKELGIRCLLTADDERLSYYLETGLCRTVRQCGSYRDQEEGICFCRSLPRLEHCQNPAADMQMADEQGYPLISVFTHEWQMDRDEIKNRMRECCIWEQMHRSKQSCF